MLTLHEVPGHASAANACQSEAQRCAQGFGTKQHFGSCVGALPAPRFPTAISPSELMVRFHLGIPIRRQRRSKQPSENFEVENLHAIFSSRFSGAKSPSKRSERKNSKRPKKQSRDKM